VFIRLSKVVSSVSLLLLSMVLGVTCASATVHIFEIQSEPSEAPEVLVIWGTHFVW